MKGNRVDPSVRPSEPALVQRIECLREPVYFRDILEATRDQKYRTVLFAWSDIRLRHALERDEYGRHWRAEK